MNVMKPLSLLTFLLFLSYSLFAQVNSNKGTDFWIGFMDHIGNDNAKMVLYITSDSTTSGTVSIPGKSWSKAFSVTKNTMTLVDIPTTSARMECSDCIEKKGINVSSKNPVVVYAHVYYQYKSDATLILPTTTAGKEYYVMNYKLLQQRRTFGGYYNEHAQFMIVASQDNTKVNITPTSDVEKSSGVHSKGTTYSITLNKGEVYQGKALLNGSYNNAENIGTHIEVIDTGKTSNCRTVSVFAGNSNCYLGCTNNRASGDNLYQQMFPVSSYGSRFVAVPFKGKNGDLVRVLASQNSTLVRIGTKNHILNAGQFVEASVSSTTPLNIFGNKPIYVAQFQTSQSRCNGGKGDPSMTILTPVEQTLEDIVLFSADREDIDDNYINVVMATKDVGNFTLDGNKVTFTPVPGFTNLSYVQQKVSNGFHRLIGKGGFNAIAYGFGDYESYGYAAGANIKNRNVYIDLGNPNYQSDLGVCDGEPVKFLGKSADLVITKWEWDFGDGNTDTLQNPTHLYKDPGTYIVKLKAHKQSSNGCSAFDTIDFELDIFATPKANFTFEESCQGDEITFTDSTILDTNYKIQANIWYFPTGFPVFGTEAKRTFQDTGLYKVSNIAVTTNSCRDTAIKYVRVNANPVVKFGYKNFCSGLPTYFTDSTTVAPGAIDKWYWEFDGAKDTSILQNPTYVFGSFGSNDVKLTVTTDAGCTKSWDTTLVILDSIKANFVANDTCVNKSFSFTNTSFEGKGSLDYTWDFGDDSTSILKSPTHSYLGSGAYQVRLIASQAGSCYDTITKTVNAHPLAIGSINYSNLCFGDSTLFNTSDFIPSGSIQSYNWIIDGQPTSNFKSFKYKFANSGKHNLMVEFTSDKGCISSAVDTLFVNAPPVAKIWHNSITDLCFGESLELRDSSTTSDSIAITEIRFLNQVSKTGSYNYTTDSIGSRYFQLYIESKYGCKDSTDFNLLVNPSPSIDFQVQEACVGEEQTLSNLSSIDAGSITSWDWYKEGAQYSAIMNPTMSFSTSGSKIIKLIGESDKGCKDSLELSVSIWDNPVANFTNDIACDGSPTSFVNTSTTGTGTALTNDWDFGDGNTSSSSSPTHLYGSPNSYDVRLIVENEKTCRDTILQSVLVAEIPTVDFDADKTIGCTPQLVNFTDLSTISNGTITSWEWDFGIAGTSILQNPTTTFRSSGMYTISLKIRSDNGCENSITKNNFIQIFNLPTADFTMDPDTPTFLNPDVQFTDQSFGSGLSAWDWDFDNGDVSNTQNPFYAFKDTGLYHISLIVTDQNGCKDTAVKSIFLTPILKVFIPNSFRPIGNGINDVFKPEGIFQGINDFTMEIYNRWGEQMFFTNDPSIGWDGKFGGKTCPQGVYFYKIRYTDYTRSKWYDVVGDITLLE